MKQQKTDKMFCPYAVHRSEVLQSHSQETLANDGAHGNIVTQIFHNKAEFAECLREQCGAFHKGRCHYGRR